MKDRVGNAIFAFMVALWVGIFCLFAASAVWEITR